MNQEEGGKEKPYTRPSLLQHIMGNNTSKRIATYLL